MGSGDAHKSECTVCNVLVCQSVIRCMCQYVSVFVYAHVFALVCPFVIGCCKSADLIYLS